MRRVILVTFGVSPFKAGFHVSLTQPREVHRGTISQIDSI